MDIQEEKVQINRPRMRRLITMHYGLFLFFSEELKVTTPKE